MQLQFVDLGVGLLENSYRIVLLVKGEGDSLSMLKKSWK